MSEMEEALQALADSKLHQMTSAVQKIPTHVYGIKQQAGGICGRCQNARLVLWVEELGGFRCTTCLRGRFGGTAGRPRREE